MKKHIFSQHLIVLGKNGIPGDHFESMFRSLTVTTLFKYMCPNLYKQWEKVTSYFGFFHNQSFVIIICDELLCVDLCVECSWRIQRATSIWTVWEDTHRVGRDMRAANSVHVMIIVSLCTSYCILFLAICQRFFLDCASFSLFLSRISSHWLTSLIQSLSFSSLFFSLGNFLIGQHQFLR